MLVEPKKPSYLTCDQAIWNTICRRQTSPVLSLVIMSVIQEYSSVRFNFLIHRCSVGLQHY